jgi:hypothetical protein
MRALLASLAFLAGACSWHSGLVVPEGAHTIGVEAARREGDVLERGLEPELTAALSEAVVDWVSLPMADPGRADLVVRSKVLEYRRRGGVRNRDNELIETAVFVRASAELFDRRNGSVVNAVAQEWSGFALDDPGNESEARTRVLRHVADALVLQLFSHDS